MSPNKSFFSNFYAGLISISRGQEKFASALSLMRKLLIVKKIIHKATIWDLSPGGIQCNAGGGVEVHTISQKMQDIATCTWTIWKCKIWFSTATLTKFISFDILGVYQGHSGAGRPHVDLLGR